MAYGVAQTYDFSSAFGASFSNLGQQPPLTDPTLLDLLKLFLGIDPGDSTQDEELTRALNFAGDFIETYLDRVIGKREVTEYFPHHFGVIELHNMPVDTSIRPVVTLNETEQTGYEVFMYRGKAGFLSRQGMRQDVPLDWRSFEQAVVTYTAGFDPIPADLSQCIVWTAAALYNSEGTGTLPGGGGSSGEVKSVSVYDVGSITYDVGSSSTGGAGSGYYGAIGPIPSMAAEVLTRYKRMSA